MRTTALVLVATLFVAASAATAQQEDYVRWPPLKSTFPAETGDGTMIKGYDPVITGNTCVTTFMAVTPSNEVYFNVVEFKAVPAQGGTLCTEGRWKSFDGRSEGATNFRMFFKDGVFRAAPMK
jgi:hypothetical protein